MWAPPEESEVDWDSTELKIAKKLGIQYNRPIAEHAADYYLLQNMWQIHKFGRAYHELVKLAGEVAPEFSTYLDLAIGGESRYADTYTRNVYGIHPGRDPKKGQSNTRPSRTGAWAIWIEWENPLVRAEFATNVFYSGLKKQVNNEGTEYWVEDEGKISKKNPLFFSPDSGYGGPKWGDIAKTQLMYLKKEIDPVMFLDRVWNLQHNGGICLNKVYTNLSNISYVLQLHANGSDLDLLPYASSKVVELHKMCNKWISRWFKDNDPDTHIQLQFESFQTLKLAKESKKAYVLPVNIALQRAKEEEEEYRQGILDNARQAYKKAMKKYKSDKKRKGALHNYRRDVYVAESFGTGDYTPPLNRIPGPFWDVTPSVEGGESIAKEEAAPKAEG